VLFPRTPPTDPGAPHEPLLVSFEKDKRDQSEHIREIRGRISRRPYHAHALEPELVTYLFDESREKRRFVRYADIPDNLKYAVLAIEDHRFFSHPGIDPFGLLGALVHYGQRTGSSLVRREAVGYAATLFVFGLLMPGVDNFAHAGGFAGGWLAGYWLDPMRQERLDHLLMALACIGLVVVSIAASVVQGLSLFRLGG
jgi:hypothetical protein